MPLSESRLLAAAMLVFALPAVTAEGLITAPAEKVRDFIIQNMCREAGDRVVIWMALIFDEGVYSFAGRSLLNARAVYARNPRQAQISGL